eukprot:932140-Pyramimonas_sp.AAC.2
MALAASPAGHVAPTGPRGSTEKTDVLPRRPSRKLVEQRLNKPRRSRGDLRRDVELVERFKLRRGGEGARRGPTHLITS